MKYSLQDVMAHCQSRPDLWHNISHNCQLSADGQHLETTIPIPELEEVQTQNGVMSQRWPIWALILRRLRRKGEIGVGDTLCRLIGYTGLNRVLNRREKHTGRSCGCAGRRARLNHHFCYY